MPKIEYAEQATDTVMAFLKQHFSWGGRPVSARQENGTWLVEVDIGVFRTRVVDRETGHIIEYQFPKPEQP
jgi:hypothetical protein